MKAAAFPTIIRDTVFDPFVSSGKPNGTGLGLAIVSKIVQDHGGSVSIERTSESGTVILVKLPRSPRPVAIPFRVPPWPRSLGSETPRHL